MIYVADIVCGQQSSLRDKIALSWKFDFLWRECNVKNILAPLPKHHSSKILQDIKMFIMNLFTVAVSD